VIEFAGSPVAGRPLLSLLEMPAWGFIKKTRDAGSLPVEFGAPFLLAASPPRIPYVACRTGRLAARMCGLA
jgi:hypothetical protein